MSDLLKKLNEQRQRAVVAAREIAERGASGEERAEDEAAYTKANTDIDRYGALMADERRRIEQDTEIRKSYEDAMRNSGAREENEEEERGEPSWREAAREAIVSKRSTKGGTYEQLPNIRNFVRMRNEQRATLDKTNSGRGTETVPVTLVGSLFEKVFDDVTLMNAGVTILRTNSGEKLKFPRLASLGALSQANARVAELGQIQKSEPTFDQVELDAYKYGQISQTGRELVEDSVLDIEAIMGQVLGRNIANYMGQDLMSGDGSSKPRGVLDVVGDTTANLVTGATGQTGKIQTSDQLLDLVWKLHPAYRRNAKFMMNDATVLTLRKFKVNGEAENYAWQPGTANTPDTLLGYPLLTDPYVPVAALSAISIVFADFSHYYVRLVNDVRIEWSTEFAWDYDLVSVKAVVRCDGDSIDDTAFAGFKGGAS